MGSEKQLHYGSRRDPHRCDNTWAAGVGVYQSTVDCRGNSSGSLSQHSEQINSLFAWRGARDKLVVIQSQINGWIVLPRLPAEMSKYTKYEEGGVLTDRDHIHDIQGDNGQHDWRGKPVGAPSTYDAHGHDE